MSIDKKSRHGRKTKQGVKRKNYKTKILKIEKGAEKVSPQRQSFRLRNLPPESTGLVDKKSSIFSKNPTSSIFGYKKKIVPDPIIAVTENGRKIDDRLAEKLTGYKDYISNPKRSENGEQLYTPIKGTHKLTTSYSIITDNICNQTLRYDIFVRENDLQEVKKYVEEQIIKQPELTDKLNEYHEKQRKLISNEPAEVDVTLDKNGKLSERMQNNLNKLLQDKPSEEYVEILVVVTPASIDAQSKATGHRNQNQIMEGVPASIYGAASLPEGAVQPKKYSDNWGHLGANSHSSFITQDPVVYIAWLMTGKFPEGHEDKKIPVQSRKNLTGITRAANLYMAEIEFAIGRLSTAFNIPVGYRNRQRIREGFYIGIMGTYFINIYRNEKIYEVRTNYDCQLVEPPYFQCQKVIYAILEHCVNLIYTQPKVVVDEEEHDTEPKQKQVKCLGV